MPAPPIAPSQAHLNPNPRLPFWTGTPHAVGTTVIVAGSAQLLLWSMAQPTIAVTWWYPPRPKLNPNPKWPFWAVGARTNPAASVSTGLTVTAVSAQLRLWTTPGSTTVATGTASARLLVRAPAGVQVTGTGSIAAPSAQMLFSGAANATIKSTAFAPIRPRLNPNPKWPFWTGVPRAVLPTASTSATVTAVSAQIRLVVPLPAVLTTGTSLIPTSAQLRLWSNTTGNVAVAAPVAQLRLRSRAPAVSGSGLASAVSGQLRIRGSAPTVAGSSSVTAVSAQLRIAGGAAPTVSTSSAVGVGASFRLWSYGSTVVTGTATTVSAPSAQIRVNANTPTVLAGTVVFASSSQLLLWSRAAQVTGTTNIVGASAQVRFRSFGAVVSVGTSIQVQPPTAQIRLRAGVPSVAASSTIRGVSAQVRLRTSGVTVSIDSTSSSVTAGSAQARFRGVTGIGVSGVSAFPTGLPGVVFTIPSSSGGRAGIVKNVEPIV